MRTWFFKIAGVFRDFGSVGGIVYLADRALSALSPDCRLHFYELMVQPITGKPLLAGKFSAQLETRVIRAGDPEIALMPVRPEIMAARLRQQATCIGAFKRGAMIGYMWFCEKSELRVDEVRCTYVLASLQNSVSISISTYSRSIEWVWGLSHCGTVERIPERPRHRYTFSRLTRFNVASRRAHQHLGWKVVGRALFLQLGRLELMGMATRVFPYFQCLGVASEPGSVIA